MLIALVAEFPVFDRIIYLAQLDIPHFVSCFP